MKYLLPILFCFSFCFAQEKKVDFNKKLTYKLLSENNNNSNYMNMYYNHNQEAIVITEYESINKTVFIDKNGKSDVNFGLGNRLYADQTLLYTKMYEDTTAEFRPKYKIEKTNETDTVLGMPCQYFLLTDELRYSDEEEEIVNNKIKVCINQNFGFNNVDAFIYRIAPTSVPYESNTVKPKGLVLKVLDKYRTDVAQIVLSSVEDVKEYVYFDHKKSLEQEKEKLASMKKYVEEALTTKTQDIDSLEVEDYDTYTSVPNYQSTYKNKAEDEGLAIDYISNEKEWNSLPKHCKYFDYSIPSFNDKNLAEHLANYVGQICDMYLTQHNYHNVSVKITMDEIRREALYLMEIKDKLNKSDQKKLDNYLKNLD